MALVFAHRGGPASAPRGARENTLAAFRAALAAGAELESDAWLTRDGVVVLDHDGRFRVRGPRRRPVAALERTQLPAHVPSLAELYEHCGAHFQLALDVCDVAAAGPLLAVARAHDPGATTRLWLCHPDAQRAASWRALDPDVRLVLSSERWLAPGETPDDGCARLAGLGLDALNLPAKQVQGEIVDACRAAGLALFAWGVRSTQRATELARLGVDGVMGDDVESLTGGVAAAARTSPSP